MVNPTATAVQSLAGTALPFSVSTSCVSALAERRCQSRISSILESSAKSISNARGARQERNMRGQSIPAFRGRRPSRLYFWSRGSTCPVRAANDLDVFTRGYSDLPWRAASRRSCRTGRRKPAIRVGRLRGCELLRSFVAVADCGGFHRAAERLNLTGTGEPRIPARRHRWEAAPKVRFAQDSLLEQAGFELSVPPERKAFPKALDRFRRPSVTRRQG